jgi:hypothetical protein
MISLTERVRGVKDVRLAFLVCAHLIITYYPFFYPGSARRQRRRVQSVSFPKNLYFFVMNLTLTLSPYVYAELKGGMRQPVCTHASGLKTRIGY